MCNKIVRGVTHAYLRNLVLVVNIYTRKQYKKYKSGNIKNKNYSRCSEDLEVVVLFSCILDQ